jgi:hypothetical protein
MIQQSMFDEYLFYLHNLLPRDELATLREQSKSRGFFFSNVKMLDILFPFPIKSVLRTFQNIHMEIV